MRAPRFTRALSAVTILAVSAAGLGASASGSVPGTVRPQVDPAAAPRSIVFECFEIDRGPDPNAVVRTQTKNFGYDTLIVRKVERMCEPALKLPDNADAATGTIVMQPNAVLALGTAAQPDVFMLDGALGLLRESPSLPGQGKVLGMSMQGGAMLGDSFFDVFTELDTVGSWAIDSFFDISYRIEFPGGQATTMSEMQSQGGGVYTGLLVPAVQVGGIQLTHASLTLNDPTAPANPAITRVLECFRTQRGADPNDPYALVTKNFGTDKVIVRESRLLCEGALKTRQPIPAGTAVPLKPPNVVWECFRLNEGDSPNKFFRLFTQNFGPHRVRVQRAFELCEDAQKVRVDAAGLETAVGNATGRVWECYKIEGKNQEHIFWLTTRNFGQAPVRVRRASVMCEMAQKIPLHTFAGGGAND